MNDDVLAWTISETVSGSHGHFSEPSSLSASAIPPFCGASFDKDNKLCNRIESVTGPRNRANRQTFVGTKVGPRNAGLNYGCRTLSYIWPGESLMALRSRHNAQRVGKVEAVKIGELKQYWSSSF